jgi:BatD DUF11 like domain
MKRIIIILVFVLPPFLSKAQVVFRTVVPQQPVVAGESFQVQYTIEDAEKVSNFFPPGFKGFRLVAGPNTYAGSTVASNRVKQLQNIVYTLSALKPGRFIITGAITNIHGKSFRSNDVAVQVISKQEASKRSKKEAGVANSEYFLHPGEDPYEKIRKNLFLKVMVDRNSCFVGEPVMATFKLYSRLESKSDIVKNPGFYGFAVYDMVNLADRQNNAEIIDGKTFDVHTIRKVQLYPLQEGHFTVDAMEVKNSVEFSRSAVNKKTEQEVVEGVLGNNTADDKPAEGTETFETAIRTEPVLIKVKPVPVKNKPPAFNGATGNFSVSARVSKGKLAKNEEGDLVITINGKGNFTQVIAPSIAWPVGVEGFEPVIKDSLDKTQSPLTGSRTFRYAFISDKPGDYQLQPVIFSFFNTDSGLYKTVSASVPEFSISREEKIINRVVKERDKNISKTTVSYWWISGAGLLAGVVGLCWFLVRKRKKEGRKKREEKNHAGLSVIEILEPAYLPALADDKSFYGVLHQCIWNHFGRYFNLEGSDMNKDDLYKAMKEKGLEEDQCRNMLDILQQCEEAMFTKAEFACDKQELLNRTKTALEEIKVGDL